MSQSAWVIDESKSEDHWLELRDQDGWWHAVCKWDGCVDLDHYANIPHHVDPKRESHQCCDDYMHICDIDAMIERLQALKAAAKAYFDGRTGEEYWT